jgi:MFS family permease
MLTVVSIAIASALVPLSSTMLAVALPHIARDFDISRSQAGLLVTVYLVAMLAGQPISGRICDAVGARRTGIVALSGFAASCTVAMFAPGFAVLLAARVGQALFASALTPSVQSELRAITPPGQRGRVYGLFGAALGVGAASGPVVGGILIAVAGWHAIFAVNLPVVAVALVVFWRLPESERHANGGHAHGESVFNPTFRASYGSQTCTTLAQYALLLLVPILLDERGWGSIGVGLVLASLTLGMVTVSPVAGRIGDRAGYRRIILTGTALTVGSLAVAAVLGADIPAAALVAVLVAFGVGLGSVTPSLTTLAIESVPPDRSGLASGVLSTSRYAGSIVASVTLGVLLGDGVEGIGAMLWISLVATVAALGFGLLLPRHPVHRRAFAADPAPSAS